RSKPNARFLCSSCERAWRSWHVDCCRRGREAERVALSGRLRRLVFVRAGDAAGPREPGDPPLSEQGGGPREGGPRRWGWGGRGGRVVRVASALVPAGGSGRVGRRCLLVPQPAALAPIDRGRFAGMSSEE